MAASSEGEIDQLEELEELFGGDTTDDLFIFNEIESSSESPVSAKDNFLSTNSPAAKRRFFALPCRYFHTKFLGK